MDERTVFTAATPGPEIIPAQRIRFTGNARNYFNIWIVNVILSVVTLGIYSAWAKVRRVTYFYGNTFILGDPLQYHATGKMILIGRLIALAFLAVYMLVGLLAPLLQIGLMVIFIPIYPWVINRSLRFQARMTSWRNVRFDFHGKYWPAFVIFILWPLGVMLTLGLTAPFAVRGLRRFYADNHSWGTERFKTSAILGDYYRAFFKMLLLATPLFLFAAGMFYLLFQEIISDPGGSASLPVFVFVLQFFAMLSLVVVGIFYQALNRNIMINALELGGHREQLATFRSDLDGLRLAWIVLSNIVVTLATLLLMAPWAAIRLFRYQAQSITVEPKVGDIEIAGTQRSAAGVAGHEFADLQGIDIGI